MKIHKENITSLLTGSAFVVLGLLLLASLLDWVDSSSIYSSVLPIGLILAGFSMLSALDNKKRTKSIAIGILGLGIVSLLVRFDVIRGDVVNAILGVGLLALGTSAITRVMGASKVNPSTDQEK
jgi:FtsH-binding integral membrane protein